MTDLTQILNTQTNRSPTDFPSSIPSVPPSDQPSLTPSVSPTDRPSLSPSESPSVSQLPTFNTPAPSESPSISQAPSVAPTGAPSISMMPSSVPSAEPSAQPSASPTGSLYYPDWINENQVCVNDGGKTCLINNFCNSFRSLDSYRFFS